MLPCTFPLHSLTIAFIDRPFRVSSCSLKVRSSSISYFGGRCLGERGRQGPPRHSIQGPLSSFEYPTEPITMTSSSIRLSARGNGVYIPMGVRGQKIFNGLCRADQPASDSSLFNHAYASSESFRSDQGLAQSRGEVGLREFSLTDRRNGHDQCHQTDYREDRNRYFHCNASRLLRRTTICCPISSLRSLSSCTFSAGARSTKFAFESCPFSR